MSSGEVKKSGSCFLYYRDDILYRRFDEFFQKILTTNCLKILLWLCFTPISTSAQNVNLPYANKLNPMNVYWGDTHLHTKLSMDAFGFGNKALGPEEAYHFAKGETITTYGGMKVSLIRPLDFLIIADHAINMGVVNGVLERDPELLKYARGKRWLKLLEESIGLENIDAEKSINKFYEAIPDSEGEPLGNNAFQHSVWNKVTSLADEHNIPGQFTALIGYEWTSNFNLHRVVVFKDDAKKAQTIRPLAAYEDYDPEALWRFMDNYEVSTGGEVLAIPHNGNFSGGVMFALEDAKGSPLSTQYAKTRSRWEPLYEVTQIKGDTETHPVNSPNDAFADYETKAWERNSPASVESMRAEGYTDYQNWYDKRRRIQLNFDWMRQYEYARSALKLGLDQQKKLGVNPFKFGLVGGTDSHTSLATADDSNFWGIATRFGPSKSRIKSAGLSGWGMSSAGYTAVWAKENTREEIFNAMKRKEVYATTGPRIIVRIFGGWDYDKQDAFRPDLAHVGYAKGVPMGGDLAAAPRGKAPSFLISAVKDPDGANLDRVQLIKGWRSVGGELQEKIYNVSLSDNRKVDKAGEAEPVGSTVNIKDASYLNSIGDPQLAVVWEDPDFDPSELAFYYVRVLEIPTPRWTAYDAKYFKLKDIPEEVPMITQERAYTSPIWYSPK